MPRIRRGAGAATPRSSGSRCTPHRTPEITPLRDFSTGLRDFDTPFAHFDKVVLIFDTWLADFDTWSINFDTLPRKSTRTTQRAPGVGRWEGMDASRNDGAIEGTVPSAFQERETTVKTMTRYARSTIENRALRMLRALGTSPDMREAMEAHGYTQAEQDEGWALCIALASCRTRAPSESNVADIQAALDAVTAFARTVLPRLASGVKRFHPDHYDAFFDGLELNASANTLVETTIFFERYESLVAKKSEHAVVALFAERRFDKHAAAELRGHLEVARERPEAVVSAGNPSAKREAIAQKLQVWLDDWTVTARIVFQRRDQLVRLGVAKRSYKAHAAKADAPPAPAAPVAAPPALPAPPVRALPAATNAANAA